MPMILNILVKSKINISLCTDLIFTDHFFINFAKVITAVFIAFI